MYDSSSCQNNPVGLLNVHRLLRAAVRLIEKLRATAAELFGVPRKQLRLSSHFVSAMSNTTVKRMATMHVDEESFDSFHYSAILWLNPVGEGNYIVALTIVDS